MEERRIWLPAGLESPGLEPDDRASQRSEPSAGKRPDRAPAASGEKGPFDQEEEPQRERSESGSGGEEKAMSWDPPDESADAGPAEEPRASKPTEEPRASKPAPKPRASKPPRRRPQPAAAGEGNGQPKKPPRPREQRRDEHRPSQVDAMGQDKYREVVGKRYGLSRARQFLYYGVFVAFVVAAYIGLKAAADSLDKAPAHDPDQAPWSQPGAPQGPLGGFEPNEPGNKGSTDFQ